MSKKEEKKELTQEEQLEQDIARFDVQIIQLDTQLKQTVGARLYAQSRLKKVKEEKKKEK